MNERSNDDGGGRRTPRRVGRVAAAARDVSHGGVDAEALREAWWCELAEVLESGSQPARVDLRGGRVAPPVVVIREGLVSAHDLAGHVRRLRSRHRAFSQVAGRYALLAEGARGTGAELVARWWDLEGDGADLAELASSVATYLGARVEVRSAASMLQVHAAAPISEAARALADHNLVAWTWLLSLRAKAR